MNVCVSISDTVPNSACVKTLCDMSCEIMKERESLMKCACVMSSAHVHVYVSLHMCQTMCVCNVCVCVCVHWIGSGQSVFFHIPPSGQRLCKGCDL